MLLNAAAPLTAHADAVDSARDIRLRGCGTVRGVPIALQRQAALNAAARGWADGRSLHEALVHSGYRDTRSAAVHVSGDATALQAALSTRFCQALSDANLSDIGSYHRGNDTWLILAAPFLAPPQAAAASVAARVLTLVNRARSQPRRCGNQAFPAAAALIEMPALTRAAAGHAQDMATRRYFSHTGPAGDTPAQRLDRNGYTHSIVGENIALGPTTPEEVVQGWLASAGHCENIMERRLVHMGLAFASDPVRSEVYWVQELAAPLGR